MQRENEGIDFPDHFSLESVKKRLNLYDVSNTPDVQILADVMIMFCIRPAEIKDLRISNGSVTGYSKNREQQDNPRIFRSLERDEERAKLLLTWIQDAISSGQLRDPGVPGVKWFNTFLKKDRFLPETGKPLLPSYLRKLGVVFAWCEEFIKCYDHRQSSSSTFARQLCLSSEKLYYSQFSKKRTAL